MTVEEIAFSAIGSLGFPIFVAWYLLTYLRKSLDANTKAIIRMNDLIERLCGEKKS